MSETTIEVLPALSERLRSVVGQLQVVSARVDAIRMHDTRQRVDGCVDAVVEVVDALEALAGEE